MKDTNMTYWQKQAQKHRRMAATLYKKAETAHDAPRWIKQARSNEKAAAKCEARDKNPGMNPW